MIHYSSCKRFSGYKPCFSDHDCYTNGCKEYIPAGKLILIINLDAMGDILMTTAQLPAIKRKFPESTLYWVTLPHTVPLIQNNPAIDKPMGYTFETIEILEHITFDVILNVDKSQRSCALLKKLNAAVKLGFTLNQYGKIIPANNSAEYNYLLGMDDHLKFKVNTKTGEEYLAETFELDYQRDEYSFYFTDPELEYIEQYKSLCGVKASDKIIGFNTGCSNLYPNKKMTVEQHRELISRFLKHPELKIMLLGGPEDTERNKLIAEGFTERVISTPTTDGLRRGACYESIPQVIISGDSFGMHLAIALKKFVIVWFGLSCQSEIELFDRGIKLYPQQLECSPCWKKSCPFNLECISLINLDEIEKATLQYFAE